MVPQCAVKLDMQTDAVYYGTRGLGIEGNIVYSDIDHLPSLLMANGVDNRVNLIFATQVFEHLPEPKLSMKLLFDSLLPGGALTFAAPQQAQFHLTPHDYYRVTKEAVLHLLQSAGFCVPKWAFAGGGDFVFDIARNAGLLVGDFPQEEIAGSFQLGYDVVSDGAVTLHALAFKPPHTSCP